MIHKQSAIDGLRTLIDDIDAFSVPDSEDHREQSTLSYVKDLLDSIKERMESRTLSGD